jgi:hypothetical protein
MTDDELNDNLDAMLMAAGDDSLKPGLITAQTDDWINRLSTMQTSRLQTIADGIRIRESRVSVSTAAATSVLSRAAAGDRGEPYRDLEPQKPNGHLRRIMGSDSGA